MKNVTIPKRLSSEEIEKLSARKLAEYKAGRAEYRRQLREAKKSEAAEVSTTRAKARAHRNGVQEGIEIAIGRVETLLAEKNGLKARESEILAELAQLLK